MLLDTFTPDDLLVGSEAPVISAEAVITGGNYARGTALGKIALALGNAAAGENTGDGEISGVALSGNAVVGDYVVTCIKAPSGAAANDAVFSVVNPNGDRLADATQGLAYTGEINFTIGAADQADFVVGDSFTVPVAAGSGYLTIVNSTAVNGSQEINAILAEAVDASLTTKVAPIYLSGEFRSAKVVFGGTDTAADHCDKAREKGIYLK